MLSRLLFGARLLLALGFLIAVPIWAEKPQMLETPHYRIYYSKKHEAIAGEALKVAESVWPTLAKAYDAYSNYQTIDIFLVDPGDFANGEAMYPYSRVEIFVPHLNWVMRGRASWLGNVVTHEISHVFSLRQKARLWIFSDAMVGGYTFNHQVNWAFALPWVPLVAPSWYVEGIAQFESETAGWDTWDSQRDMIVRDAWLTHTLPTLGQIETYDGKWPQGERVYNTGFSFLRYLRDQYGIDKVRQLAFPKPFFNFGGAVKTAFGKSLSDLYQEWQGSLAERYGNFQDLPRDTLFDKDIQGSFTQNLTFSPDGQTIAWLGNGDRDYPLNWIYWKDIGAGINHSSQPATSPVRDEKGLRRKNFAQPSEDAEASLPWINPIPKVWPGTRNSALQYHGAPIPAGHWDQPTDRDGRDRSEEILSVGLEFNGDGTRLLTTRNDWYSSYNDIWEYELHAHKSESEKWHRLTWNIRASYASYHPSQLHTIVFSKFEDGSSNVAILDSTGRVRQLTRFQEGQQVYNPRFTPAGDSIYFTLGIGENEAIAAVASNSPGWDPFKNLEDSAQFPDSLYLAKGQHLRFITPLSRASYRDLRFSGDTLLYSSNGYDSVYNVFARLSKDSTVYRMTQNRTQALEPMLHGGDLYYQGYEHQQFRIFRQGLVLQPVGPMPRITDTLPSIRPKKKDFTKAAESGEPSVKKVAWAISPYLNLSPVFLDDTTLTALNLDVGLQVAVGPVSGGWNQVFGGYFSKRTDWNTPLDYGVSYAGNWSGVTTWHQLFGWTPNLGYSISHDVRHRNLNSAFIDTVSPDVGADRFQVRTQIRDELTYTYDIVQGSMSLPLSGMRLGPGMLGTYWSGRYWNENLLWESKGSFDSTNLRTGEDYSVSGSVRLMETSMHRHFFQEAGVQWYVPAYGTPLPEYIGVYASVAQWWARYSLDPIPTDQLIYEVSLLQNKPVALYQFPKEDFLPWQTNFGWFWSWSFGNTMQLSFYQQAGFFTNKFPTVTDNVLDENGNVATVENPHPNLWVMPYRLGLGLMPAYPYSFYYRGHDVLSGTAMSWARVEAAFPLKIRQFFDYPSPLTSLNKLQLSVILDAGTVLNKAPDQLIDALNNGEHHLLMDYGVKLSATFLLYHWIPMELYGMAFMPYNQLKANRLFLTDWQGYTSREAYLKNVNQPRFFVGFTLGSL